VSGFVVGGWVVVGGFVVGWLLVVGFVVSGCCCCGGGGMEYWNMIGAFILWMIPAAQKQGRFYACTNPSSKIQMGP